MSASSPSLSRRGARLLGHAVRTHPGPFAVSVAGAVLFSVMAVGGTIVLGRVTDDVILPSLEDGVDASTVWIGAGAIVATALARMLGVVLRRYFGHMTLRRMQMTWFHRVTDRYLEVPLPWFSARSSGELLAHTDADAERATMALMPLPFSIGVVVIILVACVQLAIVDPLLMAVGLALFPGLALLNRVYTSRVEVPASRAQAQVGRVSAVAHESLDGALLVKTLGLEHREQARLEHEAALLRDHRVAVGRLRAAFEPALDALPNLAIITLLVVGTWRLSSGAVTTGDLVQAMALFGILAFPFRVVGFLLEELPRAVVAEERLRRVLDTAAPGPDRAGAPVAPRQASLPPGPLGVEVDAVSYAHASVPVLRGVSFDVAPGEVVALVGATGSGKSTICSLLAGLLVPGHGQVRLGGVALEQVDDHHVREAVALVFQETFLFADTVRENLTLGREVGDAEVEAALGLALADGFVRRLPGGLDAVLGERGVTLSGGQRQRLALARALVRRPSVLILDDATSAVDAVVERRILDRLRDDVRATTIVVAHRLATITAADRVLYLDGGRIAAAGDHRDLLAVPGYAALARAYETEAAA